MAWGKQSHKLLVYGYTHTHSGTHTHSHTRRLARTPRYQGAIAAKDLSLWESQSYRLWASLALGSLRFGLVCVALAGVLFLPLPLPLAALNGCSWVAASRIFANNGKNFL